MPRALGLRHLYQRSTDQMRDNHHLQQVRLFNQRQAILLGQLNHGLGDAPNKGLARENHQPSNAAGIPLANQTQQVGFISGMVDPGDKHQLAAHDPLANAFVLGHIRPTHAAVQIAGASAHGHFFQAGQRQNFLNGQAQATSCVRRLLISSSTT